MATSTARLDARARPTRSRAVALLDASLSWRSAAIVVTGLLALVALTNRWMSWGAGFVYARADDERAYLLIAKASPDLPHQRLAQQHAGRWPLHWLIGAIADVSGAAPEIIYRYAAIALAFAVLLVLAVVLKQLGVSTATALLCLAVLALSPYALRYYALAPGYLADLGFELGLAAALLGLVTQRLPLLLVGALAGVLCRQTMLPLLPIMAVWVALAPEWREGSTRRARLGRAVLVLAAPLAAYGVAQSVAQDFSLRGVSFSRLTIIDHVAALPGTAHDLLNHFAHVAIVLLPIGGLLAAALLCSGSLRRLPFAFWGSLAIGLAIVAQAAALNPDPIFNDYSSSNEPRLTALALGALVVALASARQHVERSSLPRRDAAPALALLALVVLTIASLHQDFTIVSTGSAGVTFALQAAAALVLFAAAWRGERPINRRG